MKKYNESVEDDIMKLPTHVTLHGLRHTSASLLVKSGKLDIQSISENLGHSKTSTTFDYYVKSLMTQVAKSKTGNKKGFLPTVPRKIK